MSGAGIVVEDTHASNAGSFASGSFAPRYQRRALQPTSALFVPSSQNAKMSIFTGDVGQGLDEKAANLPKL
jgi:hypothetical protein